ncbi:MAG: hypothetical protein GWO20_12005 [Candidatus Korarchaeota archaeon]|nr:hypothetical protein [Candidatus Korarchaeota archaeon]NIU84155.1 hypothetical protein [Candidatus Thorarchaeota archaeon]NIW14300.1 hypothetical protein [Candidatus Thorarchaeota archaeon]NIW52397.1 hypothetical protein [Candidatus Korarchaeota archaeon]
MLDEKRKFSVKDLKDQVLSKQLYFPREGIERIRNAKDFIEDTLNVRLEIGERELKIISDKKEIEDFLQGESILKALSLGFSPTTSLKLRNPEYDLQQMDIKKYGQDVRRIKGRIIGREGKTKEKIEKITNTSIVITKRRVAVIGRFSNIELALKAIQKIASGQRHQTVYRWLNNEKRRLRWE